jgi:hypothetical protein
VSPNDHPTSPEVQAEATADAVARLLREGLISTSAAARLLAVKHGKPVHASTISRWANEGVRLPGGRVVRLEAIRLGGRVRTTEAAVHRFVCHQQAGGK